MKKNIYIILTRSDTFISKLIALFTDEPFTHASIAFDDSLDRMYSFARLNPSIPLPAGLKEEDIHRGFYKNKGKIPCMLLYFQVDERIYWEAKEYLNSMLLRRHRLRYSIAGLMLCKFGIKYEFKNHYFCSQFVSKVLSEGCRIRLPKHSSLMHPVDLLDIPELIPIYSGDLEDIRSLTPPCYFMQEAEAS